MNRSYYISIGGYEENWFTNSHDAVRWIITFYGKSWDKFVELVTWIESIKTHYYHPDTSLDIRPF